MSEPDVILAKKKLACDLKILVGVQVIALCVAGLGFFFVVNPLDEFVLFYVIIALTGSGVWFPAAVLGFQKLVDTTIPLPTLIRFYLRSVQRFFLLFLLFLFLPFAPPTLFCLFLFIFPFYSIIGQFFIARWLENEPQGGTMESQRAGDEGTP
jgi:hypothetical protein